MRDEVNPYLNYLDKEMTIMGILSAFCIGAAALVAREVLKVSDCGPLFAARQEDFYYIVAGSGLMIVAAAAFYWQRAIIAWHYGQLSLWATDTSMSEHKLTEILQESDTWSAWTPYQAGLWLTTAGLLAYFGAFLPIPGKYEAWYVLVLTIMTAVVVLIIAAVRLSRDRRYGEGDKKRTPRHRRLEKRKNS